MTCDQIGEVGVVKDRCGRADIPVGMLIVMLLAAGCSNGDSDKAPTPASATDTPTPTPVVDASAANADELARAAYDGYLSAYAHAAQVADPDDPTLARYAADPLLSRTRHNVRKLKTIGAVQVGAQKATILDSRVELGARPPTVTIRSCLDFGEMKVLFTADRSPVPGFTVKKTKVPAVVTVWRYKTGQWLVNDTKQGDHRC